MGNRVMGVLIVAPLVAILVAAMVAMPENSALMVLITLFAFASAAR